MNIINLDSENTRSYFIEIAQLHIAEIHHGALPLFGEKFLMRLYYELSRTYETCVWGAIEEGKIIGYIAGCTDVGQCYMSILINAGIPLFLLALRPLFKPHVISKLSALVTYPFRHKDSAGVKTVNHTRRGRTELLAMAVAQNARKRGIGKTLVQVFEDNLLSWGIKGTYYVSTNLADKDSNAFYQKLNFFAYGEASHHNLILQMYKKQITGKVI